MPEPHHGQEFLLSVAKRIAAARRRAGVTQEELARRLKVSVRNVQRFEGGSQNLTLLTIYNIASALDVAPDELLMSRSSAPPEM